VRGERRGRGQDGRMDDARGGKKGHIGEESMSRNGVWREDRTKRQKKTRLD